MKLQEAENIPDQENKYRRTIRDVVALCALPAVWVRYDRKLLAHSLVEVVLNALPLDFVLLQLRGLQGAPDVLSARLPGRPAWDNQEEKIAALLAPWSTELSLNEATSIPNPFGSGGVRTMRVPIGLDGEEGMVVLGTHRTDFPTEEDRLLLSVALNQAAIVLQRQRTEEAMRVAAARLQLAVRGSNIGIWEIDMPDGRLRNGHIDYMNVWEQLGYDRPLAPADFDTAIALIHPDDSTHTELSIGAYLSAASKNLEFEHRVRCKDGSYRWMLTRGVAIRNSAGIPIRLVGSSVDITDRKRAEEALRKSENRFRGYFELGLVGMAITSPTRGCLEVNEQLCRLLGYTREELLQKDWAELTHPDDLAADVAQFNRVMAGEIDGYTLDKRFIRKGGQFIDVTISVNCMRRADGSCDSFLALVQDVTERTQAQEALRVAKGRLDSAMRGSNIGIWEVDMPDGNFQTGRVRHINFWEYLGYSAAEIALDVPTSLDFAHPDDRQHTQDAFDAYLCGKTPDLEVENRGRHKNGCYRWFLTRGVAIRDATGKPIRLTGTVQDITERKRQALRQRAIADAALKINASLSVEQPLNATMQLLIDEARQIIGAHVAIAGVIPIQEPRQSVALFSLSEEYRQRQGDFASKQDPFALSEGLLVPLLGRDGQRLGAFQLAHKFEGNFTAEDEAVAVQLAAMASVAIENWTLYQQVKEVDRHKDIFLAHVSHEIRTPMNAILGMADLTLQTPLSEIQRTYLTTVKSSSEALINVINDLLDFSKIRAGKLRLDPAEFSLRKLLHDVLRTLAVAAHEKKLELICDVDPHTPDTLIGDAGRLRQVLLNLVGNAIKFTQEGQVVVLVGVGEDRDGIQTKPPHEELTPGVQLSVQVRDTGIGIPAERQKGIFNAFEQGDRTTSRRFGGTGLGLSIASRLVALMDGNLTVFSNVGQGSTFKFTVRLALRQDSRPPVAADLGGLKVLIVDDNAMQRQILEQWLRNWKAEPQSIGNGLTALQAMIRAASEGHPFSLVLLDADMPGIDGVALATRISKVPELANCRIILTTREAKADLAARHSMPVGATLTAKPLLPDELLETICRVLAALGEGVTKEKLAAGGSAADDKLAVDLSFKAATESLSILLAEDNVFNQEVIRHLLERKGHTVMTVGDGRQALDALDQKPFDLLLLDCQMPEMDGFQVVEDLRRREHDTSAHLPVVGLTALSMKGDRERCLNAGMDAYLSKPIRAAEFYEAIDQVVRKNSSPSNIDREIPVPEPIDAPTLLAACGGNSELLKKMINSFNVHARKQLQVIGKAIEAEDPQATGRSAHKLIGLLSAFSPAAAEALRVLEGMGGAGQISGAHEQQAAITQIVESLATALANVTIEQLRAQCDV